MEQLVRSFGPSFGRFCEEELGVFVSARRAEVEPASTDGLVEALGCLRESFRTWVDEYHGVVEKTQASGPHGLALSLLLGCGAEVHQAHGAFRKAIGDYITEIETKQS